MNATQFPTCVLGDIHGSKELLVRALTAMGFIDSEQRWCGGTRRLIQLGDLMDRGPEGIGVVEMFMRLQTEARAAGGDVVCLLGNHDLIALKAGLGDHSQRMSWTFNGGGSVYLEWMARQGKTGNEADFPYPESFYDLFSPTGVYGRWLVTHPLAFRLGDYVCVHAGWTETCPPSIEAANALVREELDNRLRLVWVRDQTENELQAVTESLGCRGLIAGHTIGPGVRVSAEGRLIQIDVGMYWVDTWVALGMDDAGALWTLREDGEPQRIEGDGLIPLPEVAARPRGSVQVKPARFAPGDLVQLYAAADGSWCRYLYVEGESTSQSGGRRYVGRFFTLDESGWSSRDADWGVGPIDSLGKPASLDLVPEELLAPAT